MVVIGYNSPISNLTSGGKLNCKAWAQSLNVVLASFVLAGVTCGPAFAADNNLIAMNGPSSQAAGIADGAGVWMNMWSYPQADLETYVENLELNGVRNLFVQTSRSNTPAIVNSERLGAIVDACHRRHIRVIAWSFAELENPQADAQKLIAAANYVSLQNQKVDAVAGDMEGNVSAARIEAYAKILRGSLPAHYPLVAVVFSPLNRSKQAQVTPWKTLAANFDVIAPMTYWGGRYHKFDPYSYTSSTIAKIRELSGRADVEIHVIGDGMGTDSYEIQQFLNGCRSAGATSASLYPDHKPTNEQLASLSRYSEYFPPNARFRLAAFRELNKKGAFGDAKVTDPSCGITRGPFYSLIVSQLMRRTVKQEFGSKATMAAATVEGLSAADALQVLVDAGLITDVPESISIDEALSTPISPAEALSTIAAVIEYGAGSAQAKLGHAKPATHVKKRQWLMPPAYAETAKPKAQATANEQSLNYLEAAQMVLQAKAGLK
jgi:hypothetical protein